MEMFHVQQTSGTVLCCLCGTSIAPNPSNMCVNCLRTQVDITEGLQKHITVLFCRECGRYLQPPRTWIRANLESKELLTYCLKRVKNLSKVKLVDASFIWTEPHSKRLKVKLTIQKEVIHGAILQQSFVVEYVVEDHMCEQCSRSAANPDQWNSVVQVRQKVDHKRTFLYLEQLILAHGAHAQTINIRQLSGGVDFYFSSRSHALKFVDFLTSVAPVQSRSDRQLVSQDSKSNTYLYKYTFSVEIFPVCKDDLICLPHAASQSLGQLGPLVLCQRVTHSLVLLDPATLRLCHVENTQCWRLGLRTMLSSRHLTRYVVLDIEPVNERGPSGSKKLKLADAEVARLSDFGKNDITFQVRTHLGNLLKAGDHALGYDLFSANPNDDNFDKHKQRYRNSLPDVILVKKSYEEVRKKKQGKPRPWRVKRLEMQMEEEGEKEGGKRGEVEREKADQDYNQFLEELEEDPELRANIAIYRDPQYVPPAPSQGQAAGQADDDDDEEEDVPEIPLEELLMELTLEDKGGDQDGGDGQGESMDMEM